MPNKPQSSTQIPDLAHLPIPGGDQAGTKWLIGAVLAAGKDGCACDSCKLLKKFAGIMSSALVKEDDDG